MTDYALERRCRRLARVHPDHARAEEVLTTLLECSDGRRAPRLGDALSVLRYGLAARIGSRASGRSFGRFGDAVAVAVVALAVSYAAIAAVVATRVTAVAGDEEWEWAHYTAMFHTHDEAFAAVAYAAVAVLAAGAVALGRVRAARWLAPAAAVAGVAAVAIGVAGGNTVLPVDSPLVLSVLASVVVAGAVLRTNAVARAAAVAPAWWWGMTANISALVCHLTVTSAGTPFDWDTPSVIATVSVPAVGCALVLLAAPLARSFPEVFAGSVLAALPALPWAAVFADYTNGWPDAPSARFVGTFSGAGALVLALVVLVVLRRRRPTGSEPDA